MSFLVFVLQYHVRPIFATSLLLVSQRRASDWGGELFCREKVQRGVLLPTDKFIPLSYQNEID